MIFFHRGQVFQVGWVHNSLMIVLKNAGLGQKTVYNLADWNNQKL